MGRTPTYANLAHLPYSLQVFKEALRMYPPAYAMARVALHDLEIDGYPVRERQTVVIPMYAIHRRPDYYPNPEVFRPERFASENEKALPRYAYMPFWCWSAHLYWQPFCDDGGPSLAGDDWLNGSALNCYQGSISKQIPQRQLPYGQSMGIKMVVRRRSVV